MAPLMIETKESVEIPDGRKLGFIQGVGVKKQLVEKNGNKKEALWVELRVLRVSSEDGSWVADEDLELRVSYPLPFTPKSAGGRLLERFGAKVDYGKPIDAHKILLLKDIVFSTTKSEKGFAEIDRESVEPDES